MENDNMNCYNKTAKNKDSGIPIISNGQAVLLRVFI